MNPVHCIHSSRSKAARAAFTLVELLTVIAIIALLAAIIYPAMSSAQKKAQQSTSINNLHSWYTGFTNYMAENNGDMPTPGKGTPNPTDEQCWINALPKGLGIPTYGDFATNSSIRPQYGTKSIWVNPVVPARDAVRGSFTFYYGYNDQLQTVSQNANGTSNVAPLKFSRLDNARLTILMGEKADTDPSLNYTNARAYFSSSAAQGKNDPDGVCDFLFCDGHVDSVKRSVFADGKTVDANSFTNHLTPVSWMPFAQ